MTTEAITNWSLRPAVEAAILDIVFVTVRAGVIDRHAGLYRLAFGAGNGQSPNLPEDAPARGRDTPCRHGAFTMSESKRHGGWGGPPSA